MESEQVGIELATSSVSAECDDLRGDLESDNASGSKNEAELHTMTEYGLEESQELLLQPNQPRLKSFPAKQFSKSKVEYQSFNRNGLIMRSGLRGCTVIVAQKKPTVLYAEISIC